MELFLNLCWLALLLPAYFLWRRRGASHRSISSLVFVCTLGCVLVLLFPVISASDDLHAMRSEAEETERVFRHVGHCGCAQHQAVHTSHSLVFALASSARPAISFQPAGTILFSQSDAPVSIPVPATFSRPPPVRA